jgi:hypothetical protein
MVNQWHLLAMFSHLCVWAKFWHISIANIWNWKWKHPDKISDISGDIFSIVGFEVLAVVVMKDTVFWDITHAVHWKTTTFRRNISPPPSGSNKPSSIPVWKQVTVHAFTLVSCSAYSTLKVEVVRSSKMSVHFQWTTRCYIPEDNSTLHILDS